MLTLDATTASLEIVLAGAVTTTQLPIVSSWADKTTTTFTPGKTTTASNNTSTVTIVAAPAASTQREVHSINIYNADTAAAIITVRENDSSTLRILVKITLSVGDTLNFTHANGWCVIDTNGNVKTASGVPVPSGTSGGIPYYSATNVISSSALLTANGILCGGGAGTTPYSTAAMTNGQLLVGQTSAAPLPKTVSGDATMAASGALTVSTIGGVTPGQPNFSVYLSSDQSVTSGAPTKVNFNTEEFDSGGYFDSTTNRRFTPLVAGTYLISLSIYLNSTTGITSTANTMIYKNGSEYKRAGPDNGAGSEAAGISTVIALVQFNGTTDYIEGFGRVVGTSPTYLGGSSLTYMSGFRIGP